MKLLKGSGWGEDLSIHPGKETLVFQPSTWLVKGVFTTWGTKPNNRGEFHHLRNGSKWDEAPSILLLGSSDWPFVRSDMLARGAYDFCGLPSMA